MTTGEATFTVILIVILMVIGLKGMEMHGAEKNQKYLCRELFAQYPSVKISPCELWKKDILDSASDELKVQP